MPGERDLCIAVVGHGASTSGWGRFLAEEGLPFVACDASTLPGHADVAIVLDRCVHPDARLARHTVWVDRSPPGATVLCEASVERLHHADLGEISCQFRGRVVEWDGPSAGWFRLAPPEESPSFPVACLDGDATFLVGDVAAALDDRGMTFRCVARAEDREVHVVHPPCRREQVVRFLRVIVGHALARAGFPPCRLAPMPPGRPLPFVFRVDVDYVKEPSLGTIRRRASDLGWRITGFVNVSGEEGWEDSGTAPPGGRQPLDNLRWLAAFKEEGHEIASHGVRHRLLPDRDRIRLDLAEARAILEELCRGDVVGHASPGGLWHPAAALAASDAGFRYTTEATIAWGGQPFPVLPGAPGAPLIQVPCSPVYPAFHELGARSTELFLRYFEELVATSARTVEMISWMGHPFDLEDASLELWQGVDALRARAGFVPMKMRDVAAASDLRSEVRLRFVRAQGRWLVSSTSEWDLIGPGSAISVPGHGRRVALPDSWNRSSGVPRGA